MRKAAIILSILLVIFLGFMIHRIRDDARAASQRIEAYQIQLQGLQDERNELRESLAGLEAELEQTEEAPSVRMISIFVDGFDEAELFETIFPALEAEDLTGILVLRPEWLPGLEGLPTWEEYQEMLDAGWSVCMYWNGKSDPAEAAASLEAQLDGEEPELALPDVLWTDRTLDLLRYEEALTDAGIRMVAAPEYLEGETESALLLAETAEADADGMSALMSRAGGDRILAFTLEAGDEWDEAVLDDFLTRLTRLRSEGGVIVGDEADFLAFREAQEEERLRAQGEIMTDMEQLQAQIDELDGAIDELWQAYFPQDNP